MKKVLLSAILALSSMFTYAGVAQVTPEGTPQQYEMSCTYMGQVAINNIAMQVSFNSDSTKVYFCDLFIYYRTAGTGIWTAGTAVKNEDGTRTVTVPLQYVNEYRTTAGVSHLWVGGATDASVTSLGDFVLIMDKDGVFKMQDPSQNICYAQIEKNTQTGEYDLLARCAYHNEMTLTPCGGDLTLVTPPATATDYAYTYTYRNEEGDLKELRGNVAIDGKNVYFNGFSPNTKGWVKGIADEDLETATDIVNIHIPTLQYLGNATFYNIFLRTGRQSSTFDASGNAVVEYIDEAVITYDPDTYAFETGSKNLFVESLYSGKISSVNYKFSLERIDVNAADAPEDPYELHVYDFSADSDYADTPYCLLFNIPGVSVKGDKLDTDKMYYIVFVDGERYTFDASIFTHEENKGRSHDVFPYSFTDNNFGFAGERHWIYMPEALFDTFGVQLLYYANGKEFRSNIVSVNIKGELNKVDGIDTITASPKSSRGMYDLQGRRVSGNVKGIVIENGKKYIK